ncbi:uncharacterized protein LOC142620308 [Castanea sativa]|uniref:uncharacterized protein LOC142620308 n=1 Tax=Castanea sativa TaxID=21020 RepID=UPI003F6545F1
MAFTIEEIWRARNRSLHQNCVWDVSSSIRLVHTRCHEFSTIITPPAAHSLPLPVSVWSPPSADCIKINIDVAISDTNDAIAVVARDHCGVPIKIWARLIKETTPFQAETTALLWAVQLAKMENWSRDIFEGDTKICFDAINAPNQPFSWCIRTQLLNIIAAAEFFFSCSFV